MLHVPYHMSSTTVFDAKVNGIQQLLQDAYVVQKTNLNDSAVCFQIEISLTSIDVSHVWCLCDDINDRFNCCCFLTLTRCNASCVPKLQIIVDTEERSVQRKRGEVKVNSQSSIEHVLENLGCVGEYVLLNVPGCTVIKCTVPLDKDGILDLGSFLNDAKMYWGARYKNASLFGNAEKMEGVQTVYMTLSEVDAHHDNHYGVEADDNDDEDEEDDNDNEEEKKDNVNKYKDENEETIEIKEKGAEDFLSERIDLKKESKESNELGTEQTRLSKSLSSTTTTVKRTCLSKLGRSTLFALLTGIVIPMAHVILKNINLE